MKDEITYCPKTGRRHRTFTIDLTQDWEAIDKEIDEMVEAMEETDDNDEEDCPDCEGTGVIQGWAGTYGTGDCGGPTEDECRRCGGTGYL